MSLETCKLCNKDATPWIHINGHICQNCAAPTNWIKCSEKLPDIQEKVIVYATNGGWFHDDIYIASIIPEMNRGETITKKTAYWSVEHSDYLGLAEDEVTHWMPLPSQPKFEEDK